MQHSVLFVCLPPTENDFGRLSTTHVYILLNFFVYVCCCWCADAYANTHTHTQTQTCTHRTSHDINLCGLCSDLITDNLLLIKAYCVSLIHTHTHFSFLFSSFSLRLSPFCGFSSARFQTGPHFMFSKNSLNRTFLFCYFPYFVALMPLYICFTALYRSDIFFISVVMPQVYLLLMLICTGKLLSCSVNSLCKLAGICSGPNV